MRQCNGINSVVQPQLCHFKLPLLTDLHLQKLKKHLHSSSNISFILKSFLGLLYIRVSLGTTSEPAMGYHICDDGNLHGFSVNKEGTWTWRGAEAPLHSMIYYFIFLFQGINLRNFCGDLERKEKRVFLGYVKEATINHSHDFIFGIKNSQIFMTVSESCLALRITLAMTDFKTYLC